ncbi:hypothetical protein WJX79_002492 [Trebouxia sp. C0005]
MKSSEIESTYALQLRTGSNVSVPRLLLQGATTAITSISIPAYRTSEPCQACLCGAVVGAGIWTTVGVWTGGHGHQGICCPML